ncbi:putative 30.4 kDa protein in puhA 5'region [Beijerinckiaceae bacterium RH AL1]|nr:putative 30.4 kDa protein in puhA 5'region [Beijerinckiaceae bacterium RH AL8]VVB43697.1 putative 30.4 kDa protein in puhA 5'region [Beijerinckiaceae bacterium RH CH11]VVC53958.1 putative 30.4 kDa protein in puhA 5'region [Beijerinckiaceae bacterium RH AL1]
MTDASLAILYALFVWWFSTGLVFLVVLRRRAAVRAGLIGAAALFPICLVVLAASAGMTGVAGAYIAFTAAVVLWGTQEVAFLTGFLTGPRPLPCPPGATGLDRLAAALGAILYHELALLVTSGAVVAVTWQSANPFGAETFLVLWIMRVSAKLNLFLGVPVLNDEVMPERIAYLRTYFRRGPVNPLFPLCALVAVLLVAGFVEAAADPQASRATTVGFSLLVGLTALALAEHAFMLVPLPIARLWKWSTGAAFPSPARGRRWPREAGSDEGPARLSPLNPAERHRPSSDPTSSGHLLPQAGEGVRAS